MPGNNLAARLARAERLRDEAKGAKDAAQVHLRNCTNDLAARESEYQEVMREVRLERK